MCFPKMSCKIASSAGRLVFVVEKKSRISVSSILIAQLATSISIFEKRKNVSIAINRRTKDKRDK